MRNNSNLMTIVCILMCSTLNFTQPLQRQKSKGATGNYVTQLCNGFQRHFNVSDRVKKAVSIENALNMIKLSSQDFTKNIYDLLASSEKKSSNKKVLNDENFRQYEQLVIMKKYPYLDLKELELKYHPAGKNVRHDVKFHSTQDFDGDPGICESLVEEGPNVEIINRGLTGFGIPAKHRDILEYRLKNNPEIPADVSNKGIISTESDKSISHTST